MQQATKREGAVHGLRPACSDGKLFVVFRFNHFLPFSAFSLSSKVIAQLMKLQEVGDVVMLLT